MKLTIGFALIATLLLVSANAGSLPELNDDIAEIENAASDRGIWSGMYFVLKAALKTLKGLNCTIKEVMQIRAACLQFLDSTKTCGVETTKQVQAVIDSVNNILNTCNDIINVNTNICGNGDPYDDDNQVPSGKTGVKCFLALLKRMVSLKNQMKATIKQIKALPSDTSDCFIASCNNLTGTFTAFPGNIKTCSKLTSK